MNYTLFGRKFKVSEARKLLIRIKGLCHLMAEDIDDAFEKAYKSRVGNIEGTIKHASDIAKEVLKPRVKSLMDLYFSYNIYDVTVDCICDEILQDGYFSEHRTAVIECYDEINEAADEEREMREIRKESRGRWEGGGFGMSGAIKGAAEAGALNLASGFLHSAVNAFGNMATEGRRTSAINELFSSPDTLRGFCEGLKLDVINYFIVVGETLEDRVGAEIEWVYKNDSEKAENMYQNIDSVTAESVRRDMLFQMLELDPFESKYYKYIFVNNNVVIKKEVVKLANCFFADIIDEIFEYVYEGIGENVSLEKAIKQKEEVLKRLDALEVSEEVYLNKINTIVYDATFEDFKGKIKKIDSTGDIEKISSDILKSILKDADKNKLKESLQKKNEELCTYRSVTFSTSEEATVQKTLYLKYETMTRGTNTVEELTVLSKELHHSEMHKDLVKELEDTIVKRRIEIERKKLEKIVPKKLYTLKIEEINDIRNKVLQMGLEQSLEKEFVSIINDSEEFVRNEEEYKLFKSFYSLNNITCDARAILTAAEYYNKNVNLQTAELKEMFLGEVSEDVKKIVNVSDLINNIESKGFIEKSIRDSAYITIYTGDEINDKTSLIEKVQCGDVAVMLIWSPRFQMLFTMKNILVCDSEKKEFILTLDGCTIIEDTGFFSSEIILHNNNTTCRIDTYNKKARKALAAYASIIRNEINKYIRDLFTTIDISDYVRVVSIQKKYSAFTDSVEKILRVSFDDNADGIINQYIVIVLGQILKECDRNEIDHISSDYEKLKDEHIKSVQNIDELLADSKKMFISNKLTFNNVVYNTESEKIAAEEKYCFFNAIMENIKNDSYESIIDAFEQINNSPYSFADNVDYTSRLFDSLYAAIECINDETQLNEMATEISSRTLFNDLVQTKDVLAKISDKLHFLDEAKRTYKGVVFDNIEDIGLARMEESQMDIVMSNVYADDIESINRAMEQINNYSSKIKVIYIDKLEKYKKDYDQGLRTYRGIVYDSIEKVTCAKEEYNKARDIMDMLNINDEASVKNAYAYMCSLKYVSIPEYKSKLEELLNRFDIINRTVDGILFETLEEANLAKEEYKTICTIMKTLDLNVEQTLIEGKEKLESLLTQIKLKYITEVEKMLVQYDINIRTFNGVTYETRELAALVKREYNCAVALMNEVSENNEDSILQAQKKMMELTTNVKDAFLTQLKKIWEDYDLRARTFEDIVFETRKQAQNASATKNEFYRIFNEIDLLDRQQLRRLEMYIEDELQEQLKPKMTDLVNDLINMSDEFAWVINQEQVIDPIANKKESAELYKRAEKLIPRFEHYRIDPKALIAIKEKYYGSLNAGQKMLSFFKSKF